MRSRHLAPTRRRELPDGASKQIRLADSCPLADPLAAASQKIRRKRGAGKPGDYDAILPAACARRGGNFLTARRKFFLPRRTVRPGGTPGARERLGLTRPE